MDQGLIGNSGERLERLLDAWLEWTAGGTVVGNSNSKCPGTGGKAPCVLVRNRRPPATVTARAVGPASVPVAVADVSGGSPALPPLSGSCPSCVPYVGVVPGTVGVDSITGSFCTFTSADVSRVV